jgi:hypothetical protein
MKSPMFIAALAMMALPLFAHASCEAVKSDIDAKIKANGVSHYSLDVVAADEADKSGGKVVGRCEGDKAIVYTREASAASEGPSGNTSATDGSKPADATPQTGAVPVIVGRSGQTGG